MPDILELLKNSKTGFGNLIPPPPIETTMEQFYIAFIPMMVVSVAFLVYGLYRLVKKQDGVPLMMWVGGLICSLSEPTFCLISHIFYPYVGPGWPLFIQMYGLTQSWTGTLFYTVFQGGIGYLLYRLMSRERGLTMKRIWYLWLGIIILDAVMEIASMAMTEPIPAFTYYGKHPFKLFGYLPAFYLWTNATGILGVGFMLWLFMPMLNGWKKALVLLFAGCVFPGIWVAVGWPYFLAMNLDGPSAAAPFTQYLLTILTLGISLVMTYGMCLICASDSPLVSNLKDRLTGPRQVAARQSGS